MLGLGSLGGGGVDAARSGVSRWAPPSHSAVPSFLEPYGYIVSSAYEWRGAPPCLSLVVNTHEEIDGHTHYHVDCQISRQPPGWTKAEPQVLQWRASMRLVHLRERLHDLVKQQLGTDCYRKCFHDTPFARRGAPVGTTARVDAWCRRLAECINGKMVPPYLVSATLSLFRAPDPSKVFEMTPALRQPPKARATPVLSIGAPAPAMPAAAPAPASAQASTVTPTLAQAPPEAVVAPSDSPQPTSDSVPAEVVRTPAGGEPTFFRMDGEDSDDGDGKDSTDDEANDDHSTVPPASDAAPPMFCGTLDDLGGDSGDGLGEVDAVAASEVPDRS